jgi:hypothetical protein
MNKETPIGVFKNADGGTLLIVSGTEDDIAAMDMLPASVGRPKVQT